MEGFKGELGAPSGSLRRREAEHLQIVWALQICGRGPHYSYPPAQPMTSYCSCGLCIWPLHRVRYLPRFKITGPRALTVGK